MTQQNRAPKPLDQQNPVMTSIFRAEALSRYHPNGRRQDDLLPQAVPAWTQWLFWLLLTAVGALLLGALLTPWLGLSWFGGGDPL